MPFHDTDAMGVVHHANYAKYLEVARVRFLEEWDRPYQEYMAQGLHFAVIRLELDFRRPARFDDRLVVATWIQRIRGASLRMGYAVSRGDELVATGMTDHAMIDTAGRVRRIPREWHEALAKLTGGPTRRPEG